jgi:type I restriction enzyme S subunit
MNNEYKHTKIGYFPDDWKLSKLGDLTKKIGSGITPRGGSKTYLSKGIPLIRSQNVLSGCLDISDVAFISESQHLEMKNTYLEPLDVLLNITGASIGRCCLLPESFKEGNVNQHVCIIRTNKNLDPNFLSMVLNSSVGKKQIFQFQAGGNRQGLNFNQISSFRIPLPPLAEQRRIAEILSTWDEAIDRTEQLIAALEKRKKGLMQRLLTGQTRFPGFTDKWREVKLGEVASITAGNSFSNDYQGSCKGKYPFYKVSDMSLQDNHKYLIEANNYVDEELVKTQKWKLFDKGTTVFPKVGETIHTNKKRLLSTMSLIDNNLMAIRITGRETCDSNYLFNWFEQFNLSKLCNLGAVPSIRSEDVKRLKIILPPIKEQIKIANFILLCDKQIEFYIKMNNKIQTQKKGLMQRLLTGQVRVDV